MSQFYVLRKPKVKKRQRAHLTKTLNYEYCDSKYIHTQLAKSILKHYEAV